MIPPIIHQSWKSRDIPEQWQALQQTWRALHPHHEYRFWTDEDNRNFIQCHHPDLMALHDGYELAIHRAELARYLVLRHHGGIYVDMDFEALRPIDDLVAGASLLLGLEPDSHAARPPVQERGLSRIVCNAFMASAPRHPFWDHLLVLLVAAKNQTNVLDATGPFLLTRACDGWRGDLAFAPAAMLYPFDNQQIRAMAPAALKAAAGDAYAIHHWSGSWWRESLLARARGRIASQGA